MKKITFTLITFFIAFSTLAQGVIDELNGSTLGNPFGITYTLTPNGQGAVFVRTSESRIEYPFSLGLPHEGTIELLINVSNGYYYENFILINNTKARIFDSGLADVWYLGAMDLEAYSNGDISLNTALTPTPTSHTLSASGTNFRFNEWHVISISYGSQGQYIKVDGQLVASNSSFTETLQVCGNGAGIWDAPTIGEVSCLCWANNQWDGGFEGILDRFRFSNIQQDWILSGIDEIADSNRINFQIFPNPATNKIIIETSINTEIEILNIQSQLINSFTSDEYQTTIDISRFPSGIYFVKVKTEKGIAVKKFIKE